MAETEDNVVPHERVRSLREAVNTARVADADRSDALAERRQSEKVRLELVARELESVFEEAAEKSDQFVLSISQGTPPRLWIDATSHVVMASDIRSYRFVKDTRIGRIVLAETEDVETLADRITSYIAERIVDQERAVEADWQIWRINEQAQKEAAEASETDADPEAQQALAAQAAPRRRGGSLIGFIIGLLAGAAVLGGYLQYSGLYDFRPHMQAFQAASTSAFPRLKIPDANVPAGTVSQTPAAAGEDTGGSSDTAKPSE